MCVKVLRGAGIDQGERTKTNLNHASILLSTFLACHNTVTLNAAEQMHCNVFNSKIKDILHQKLLEIEKKKACAWGCSVINTT